MSSRVMAAGVALLALGATPLLADDASPAVVVRDSTGRELLREPLPSGGEFALAYRHSQYGAPARELFRSARGGFRLRAVASPRQAVLDYYALAGRRSSAGRWLRLELHEPPGYEELSLIATPVGRRTLVVGDRRVALYGAEARHLRLTVEASS